MRLRSALGAVGAAAALGGCAGIGDIFEEPDVRLDQVVVRGLGVTGGTLDLVLDVKNPNNFDLRGTRLELGFDVEETHIGDISYEEDFRVDRGDKTTLTLPLRFQWSGVGAAMRAALSQGDLPYRMKGQVTLQTPWGRRSVPFTKEGRAPLTRPGGLPIKAGR